jgi:tripartite-type tricarboxylate transporter receptor subunit TctC
VTVPYILFARNTMPARNLQELIAWLRANSNKASAGFNVGSGQILAAFFQKETGTHFTLVPYRGNPIQDVAAGQIDLTFTQPTWLPLLRAGSVNWGSSRRWFRPSRFAAAAALAVAMASRSASWMDRRTSAR